jgi:hypothetical protein
VSFPHARTNAFTVEHLNQIGGAVVVARQRGAPLAWRLKGEWGGTGVVMEMAAGGLSS